MQHLPAVLFGVAYFFLSGYVTGLTATWGDFSAWIGFWVENNLAALTWMQFFHAVGTALAALPVAALIAWRYQSDWLRPAIVVAVVASIGMLYEQVQIIRMLFELDSTQKTLPLVSGAIDVLKIGPIFIGISALTCRVFVLRNASR